MEIQSECVGVKFTIQELLDAISEAEWEKIEKKLLTKAVTGIGRNFSTIELWDSEGHLEMGVST